jgi:hypothetical protein
MTQTQQQHQYMMMQQQPMYAMPQSYQMPSQHPQQPQMALGVGGVGGAYMMPPPPGYDYHPGQEPTGPLMVGGHFAGSPNGPNATTSQAAGQDKKGLAKNVPPAPLKSGEAPKYTPYDIDDFRRINKPVKMGGLGPNDSDEVRAARQLRERALEYAENNNRVNLVVLAAAEENVAKKPTGRQPSKEMQEVIDRRARAKEFAKNVPKPAVKRSSSEPPGGEDSCDSGERRQSAGGYGDGEIPKASNEKLLELEARHQRDQEMIAAMKRQLGLAGQPSSAKS